MNDLIVMYIFHTWVVQGRSVLKDTLQDGALAEVGAHCLYQGGQNRRVVTNPKSMVFRSQSQELVLSSKSDDFLFKLSSF